MLGGFKRDLSRFLFFALASVLPISGYSAEYTLQLDQVRIVDLARVVYGDALRKSYIIEQDLVQLPDAVSVNWQQVGAGQLDKLMRDLLLARDFELVQRGKVLLLRKLDDVDQELLVYQPRHRSARYLSDILAKVADAHQLGTRKMQASPEFAQGAAKVDAAPGSVSAMVSQSAPDQLAYQCAKPRCAHLRQLLAQLDTPEAQVLLRAAVYEVGTSQGQGSALQIAGKLLQGQLTASAGEIISGAPQIHLAAANLDAVLSVLDKDGRFKSISRPMLRVRTGAQAKFSVGQQVPVLGAISQDKNGNPVQSVEYRQSGTIFTVQPDIRQDVVDLNITQELSSFVATTTGVNGSPTLLQRTASSQLSIKPGEVVVFAGLEEAKEDQAGSSFLGIPLGKSTSNTTSEVLLFIEAQRI